MNPVRKVLFRFDGSYAIGMGHAMRCIALADFFEEAGWQTFFACMNDFANRDVLAGRTVEYLEDPAQAVEVARKFDVDIIVMDLSHRFNAADPAALGRMAWDLRGSGAYLVMIDGTRDECISSKLHLEADTVILPYVGASDRPKSERTKVLSGKYFAIYGREYVALGKIKRELADQVRNILVTMGGSDPYGLTETSLKALGDLDLKDTVVSVVVGPGFSDATKAACKQAAEQSSGQIRLLEAPAGLAQELLKTDLAIINDGLTKYEAAVTGTPSIVISNDEHQRSLSKDFSKLGCYAPFGPEKIENPKELAQLIDSVRHDANLRRQMSEIGTREFDPRGGARVVQELEKELWHGR